MESSDDQFVVLKFQNIPKYAVHLRLSGKAGIAAKMTTLMFCVDFVKERVGVTKLENKETQICFDDDNITTYEEVIQTKMEDILIKRTGPQNPFMDELATDLEGDDMIFLNDKE